MKNLFCLFPALLALAVQKPALANDAFAAMEAGNLVLKKSDGVAMESEDLYLSTEEVRVRYVFRNTTPKEVRSLVAFPVARLTYETDEKGNVWQDPELVANLNFKVAVQGKGVAAKMERKLERRGEYHLDTATYYWKQVFPAGEKLEVTHSYKPEVGGFFYYPKEDHYKTIQNYCIEPDLQATLKKMAASKGGVVPATTLHYVLSTGANWKGPIRDFKMTLDKGKPERLVSLCIDGIRKTGPTRFEVIKKNFLPKKDLQIVFFEKL